MRRRLLGGVVGVVVAWIVVAIVEGVAAVLHPLPAGLDPTNTEQMKAYAAALPPGVLAFVALAWSLGPFVGATVAALVARVLKPSIILGVLFTVADLYNLGMIASPWWLWLVGIAAPLPLAWLGGRIGLALRGGPRVEASPAPTGPAG